VDDLYDQNPHGLPTNRFRADAPSLQKLDTLELELRHGDPVADNVAFRVDDRHFLRRDWVHERSSMTTG
jgi:hypothetical protein